MLEVHRVINALGLYISELIPRFNQYEGAEIFANSTSQMRLIVTEDASVRIKGRFEDKMYTGELHPTLRIYKCRCGEGIFVGTGEAFNTIEELKKQGCPNCGVQERFRLLKKISKT